MSLYLRFSVRLLIGPLAALGIINGCGMSSDSGNSNTNWLKSCTVTGDCTGGLECVCGTCSLPCTSNASCARLGTSAACASNAALRAVCSKEALPSASLCLPNCGPTKACGSGGVCIDGVCSPGEPPDASGAGGNNGSGGALGAGGSPPGTGGLTGNTGGARTDGGAGANARDGGFDDAGSLVCGPNEHVCACATGSYCLFAGAECIAPTSPCPADYGGCGTCAAGSMCVKEQTIGGAIIVPDDAGVCSSGRVIVPEAPGYCSLPPTFDCAPMDPSCFARPSCNCSASSCNGDCTDANSKVVVCLRRVP